jgi:predicted transcriptional regulator
MDKKKATSLRLSEEAKALLGKVATKLGISQTAVVELAIRQIAKLEGVQ